MITGSQIRALRTNTKTGITGQDIARIREAERRRLEEERLNSNARSLLDRLNDKKATNDMYNQMQRIPYSTTARDPYAYILNMPDYADKSKSVGKNNMSWKSIFTGDKSTDTIENLKEAAETYARNEKYQPWENSKFNFNADTLKAINNMSAEDEGIYHYLHNTQGKETADKYLDEYVKRYTASAAQQEIKEYSDYAKKHPIISSIQSVANTFNKPVGALYSLAQSISGNEIDPNSAAFASSRQQEAIRSGVKEKYDMGNVGGFLYDTGMSTADSLSSALLGAWGGAALIGGGAATDTIKNVKEKGGTDTQAMLSGLAAGTAETLFERVSLGNLKSLKDVPIKTVKDIAMNTVKSTLVNASEEAATEISNIITDSIINGNVSDYNISITDYMSQGYSEAEARKKTIVDMFARVGLAGLGGALQGGVMSGVGQGINYASGSVIGSQVNKQGTLDNYIPLAKQTEGTPLNYLYNLAVEVEKQKAENKKPSNYQIGSMAREVDRNRKYIDNISAQKSSQNDHRDTINTSMANDTATSINAVESQNIKPVDVKSATAKIGEVEGAKVKGVANVENNKVTINIDTGTRTVTSSLDDVTFDDPAVQQVYAAASDYKTNGAKAFVENFDGNLTLQAYQKAFNDYYDAGVVDVPIADINSAYGTLIPESVRLNAYDAGINDAKLTAVKASPLNHNVGIIKTVSSEKLDADTRSGLDALGKAFGVSIQIEESIAGGQANGMYKDGTLYIALDSDNPYMTVAKHELTHGIQQFSPEKYKAYKDFVIREINKSNPKAYDEMVDRLISRYAEIGQTITRDEAMDEIVADASEMFLADPERIKDLASKDRPLAEKILDIIRDIISKIKKAVTNIEPKTRAAKILNENLEAVQESEKLWLEALADINGENEFIASNESGLEDVKFSLREKEPPKNTAIRFSLKDTSDVNYNSIVEENAKLKEAVSLLEEQFKLTKEYKPKKGEIEKVARKILKSYSSDYDVDTFVENITSLWNYIQNNDFVDGAEVAAATSGMAKRIIEKSGILDDHLKNQYSDLINKIKTTGITISDRDKNDLMSAGGYNVFRKQNFGRIKLTNNGLPVDSFYYELNELYPNMFPEEYTHPAEQLMVIANVLDDLRPSFVNPFGMDMDQASIALAYEIFDVYFDIPRQSPTFADKKKAEIEKTKAAYKQKLYEVKVEFRNEKAKTKKLEKQIQRMRDAREKGDKIRNWKAGIRKTTKELSDMLLKPKEKHYIPQAFRSAVLDVLQMIDLQTGRINPDGSQTKTSEVLDRLQRQYAKLAKEAEESSYGISSMYDEDVENDLLALAEIAQGKRIIDLSYEQLEAVHNILKHIKQMIAQENKAFSNEISESIAALGEQAIQDQASLKEFKRLSVIEKSDILKYFGDMINKGLLKPYYFFKQIGGTINKLYQNVRNGEDKYIKVINTSKKYVHDMMKSYDYNSWGGDKDKASKFTLESGSTLDLTIGQKLYIYLAYKRDQGKSHILQGGIVTDTPEVITENQNGKNIIKRIKYKSQPARFTETDIKNLVDTLTKDQVDFADKMGEFLSGYCANLGNEVSLQLVGFEKFTEKNYIPLTSDPNFLYTKAGVTDDVRIKRSGFTKALTPKASNPIIATDLLEVWTKHINDMAMYNAFVLPLEDFTRVWNYKRKGEKKYGIEDFSVKAAIQRVYGDRANNYIRQLLRDVNGGVRSDNSAGISNRLISLMKRSSVMANLSVAIQQPSSIVRALAVINPKYFAKTTFTKRDYMEMYKYSPQAVLKKYGYFDTNMGRTIQEIMIEHEYETPMDKFKAFFKDKNVRDEVFSWLPQKMDELTWGHIWNAVKAETIETTNLKPETDAFYEHVSNRFKEVIDRTQVMDSVFQRSEMMRSKDGAVKMATAFMSEPTVNFNILHDAIMEYKKSGKNAVPYIRKALASVLGGMIFNSLLKSIIGAMRDDDKDKNFGEKYLENFIGNLADDPFSMIPYLNSAVSIFEGYNVTRPDMQLVQNLYYSWTKWGSDKYTLTQKMWDTSQSLSALVGLPVKNISKDMEALWRTGVNLLENMGLLEGKSDYEKLKLNYPTIDSSSASSKYYDMLYQAYIDNDTELYTNIYNDLVNNGKKPSNIQDAIRSRTIGTLKEHDELINAVNAKIEKNASMFSSAKRKLLQEGYKLADINSAIDSLYSDRMKENAPTADEFLEAYRTGNRSVWKPIYDKMRAAGWSQKDLLELIK